MALQEITNKIRKEAEAEATSIIAKAEEEVVLIDKKTKEQVAGLEEESLKFLQKEQSQRESVVSSLEKQKTSLAKQSVKRRLLDEVYDEALKQLLNISSEDYISLLKNRYRSVVPSDAKISFVLAPNSRFEETKKVASDLGWSAEIKSDDKLKGGCILVGEDFEFNLSLEKMFAEDRLLSETEIAAILFSGSK
ncbi:MAG: V-type ATP synthase subunit E family protein [Candidatus Paceibacterota bacterium]